MNIYKEFQSIKSAFDKVKKDMFFLTGKLNTVEKEKNSKYDVLSKEIEILKLKVKSLEKKSDMPLEKHHLVGNTDSKKIHYSNCPYAHKISKENLKTFENLKQAIGEQYSECSCLHN